MNVDFTTALKINTTLRMAGLCPKTIDSIVEGTSLSQREKAVLHLLNGGKPAVNGGAEKNAHQQELVPGSAYPQQTHYQNDRTDYSPK